MKSKGGSLYEVLKSASRPGGNDGAPAGAPEAAAAAAADGGNTTLQERLAAYKAAKLAAATQLPAETAAESAPARVTASTLVLEPDPTPLPAPPPAAPTRIERAVSTTYVPAPAPVQRSEDTPLPAPAKGPGERVVKLTYNTILFGGMVAVGLLFIAYAAGLHFGKARAAADLSGVVARPPAASLPPAVQPGIPAPPAPQLPLVKKEYTIRLGEWKYVTAQDRLKVLALAEDPELKKALERAGHKNFEKALVKSGGEVKMALFVDRFSDHNSDGAKAALTAMKTFKFKNTTPFTAATFEERQPQ